MEIKPQLNINKHPKDTTNMSLVNAMSVKVSKDMSCITNEEGIKKNTFIENILTEYYSGTNYDIVGIIPCNVELVLIVKPESDNQDADIFVYREQSATSIQGMKCMYGGIDSDKRFKYHGGLIKGSFTYNVENSLIVAIAEYNVQDVKIPLRTINLGNFDDAHVANDKNIPNGLLSVAPEVKIPYVENLRYISGSSYKGWYYLYIRYKINTIDYTQWYPIGFPIYVDTLENYQITRYAYNRESKLSGSGVASIVLPSKPVDGFGAGCSDYFSNGEDIATESFKVDLMIDRETEYEKYQIGIMCSSKTYNKGFRTADITLDKTTNISNDVLVKEYELDNKSLIDHSVADFIIDNPNYYNVRNIINYQNKLYISNYLETNANDDEIDLEEVKAINTNLILSSFRDYGLVYDTAVLTENSQPNQYDVYTPTLIPMYVYLGVREDTIVTVSDPVVTISDTANRFYISSDGVTPGYAFVEYRKFTGVSTIKTYFGKDASTNITIRIQNSNTADNNNIVLNSRLTALNGGMRYINVNINFDQRKTETTLIPGEIYNFFIHYVDKYGQATNGYKLNNNVKWTGEALPDIEIIPVPFTIQINGVETNVYAGMLVDNNIVEYSPSTNKLQINLQGVKFYNSYYDSGNNPRLTEEITGFMVAICVDGMRSFYDSYKSETYLKYKWYQVSFGVGINTFHLYINDNGDRLFKIPLAPNFLAGLDGFPEDEYSYKTYNSHTLMRASFDNINIPVGYEGYYISYEEFEPIQRVTGVLTRNDFRNQDFIKVGDINSVKFTANDTKSDLMMFYSGQYDVSDTIKLDYNIMRIEAINPFKKQDIPEWDYMQRNKSFNFVHDQNKPQVLEYNDTINKSYAMPEYKLAVADSAIDNRMGLGTGLQIKDSYNLFPNYYPGTGVNNKIKIYRVTLLNTTRSLYISNNKKLIRLTDVKYKQSYYPEGHKYSTGYIRNGYNGAYTYDGALIYENAGFVFNSTTNVVTSIASNSNYYRTEVTTEAPHTYQNDIPFLAYCQFPVCTDLFYESKSYKAPPLPIVYVVKNQEDSNTFATGCIVTPANSIDLFQNRQGTAAQFNAKTYTNYRTDLVSIEQFDKTVRRSNVIQDESRTNGWRRFPIEAYKNIAENKGKISNLVGIGTILLVHTEHSLFMFDTSNTLQTNDKEIQLSQPDAFEVDYKEVFTSDKGFGGLQDDKSYVVDQFGYIFYSNDFNRFYRFDSGQLDILDEDIVLWLVRYKPYGIRIANDKENDRLLIKMFHVVEGVEQIKVLSYNYVTKSFISFHPYDFKEAYTTKSKLYLQCNEDDHVSCNLHEFVRDGSLYANYDNIKGLTNIPTTVQSSVSICINERFDIVKYLDYFTYKLTKVSNATAHDNTIFPVEGEIMPYSGSTIKVLNNQINTGQLDVAVDVEEAKNPFANYMKPYWNLGVWNFSYLRNNISERPSGLQSDNMSRLFGNYFIIEMTFNNEDNKRIELEDVTYTLI